MGREEIFDALIEKVRQGKLDEIEALGFKREGDGWVGYGLRIKVRQQDGLTVLEVERA